MTRIERVVAALLQAVYGVRLRIRRPSSPNFRTAGVTFDRALRRRAAAGGLHREARSARRIPRPSSPDRRTAGVTLIEMVVALAILGIMAAVTGVALRREDPPTAERLRADRIAAARREALDTRRAVAFAVADSGGTRTGIALPDGRVVADSALAVDPLTGRPDAADR